MANSTLNELGRSLYKAIVVAEENLVRIFDKKSKTWYRNSLLQNYFRFGSSDIDLSVQFSSNKDIVTDAKKIQSILSLCPLNKEINFYYPFVFEHLSFLANPYELSRDPVLKQMISASEKDLEAKKFVYLLRMLYSNLNQIKNGLSLRDIEKWKFHFTTVGFPEIANVMGETLSKEKLLQLIFVPFPQLKENVQQVIARNVQDQIDGITLNVQMYNAPSKEVLNYLLPHLFTIKETNETQNPFLEKILIAQISWEVLALLTQPTLFPEPGFEHLRKLQQFLKKLELAEASHDEARRMLLKILSDYQLLFN